MEEFVLCIDIGTSSVKSALVGFKGKVICFHQIKYSDFPEACKIAEIWENCVTILVNSIRRKIKTKWERVKGVCISGNGPTFVLQDKTTFLWNHKVDFEIPAFGKSLFLPRLFALKKLYPQQYLHSQFVFSGPEYLIYSMTGNAVTILPQHSFSDFYWPRENLNQFESSGIFEDDLKKLPPFVLSGTIAGLCKNSRFNLDNLPVICGAPDFVSALVGTGTIESGKMCNRAGSSEGFNLCTSFPMAAENIRCMPSIINGLWNASTLIPDSGSDVYDLFCKKISNKIKFENYCSKINSAFTTLKNCAALNNQNFPDNFVITGGQSKIKGGIKLKKKLLGSKINLAQIPDAELLGNGCIGFVALGKYDSLQNAVKNIVHLRKLI